MKKTFIQPNPPPGHFPDPPSAAKPKGYGSRKGYMKPVKVSADPMSLTPGQSTSGRNAEPYDHQKRT